MGNGIGCAAGLSVGALIFGSLVLFLFTVTYRAVSDNSVYLIPLGAVLFMFAGWGSHAWRPTCRGGSAGQ